MSESGNASIGNVAIAAPDAAVNVRRGPHLGKLLCVDWLRGLAAVLVVIHHGCAFFYRVEVPHPSITRHWIELICHQGFLGVSVFFVISGFCIHLPYVNSPRLPLREFFVRRFWRLYPPYIAVAAVALALFYVQYRHTIDLHQYVPYALGHVVFWYYGDHGSAGGMGITPVLWTIAVEVYFYILYAVTYRLLRAVGIGRMAIGILVFDFAYRLIAAPKFESMSGGPHWLMALLMNHDRFAIARFGEWLLGAWLAEALVLGRIQQTVGVLGTSQSKISASVAVMALGYLLNAFTVRGPYILSLMACCATALLLAGLVQAETTAGGELGWLQRHGKIGRWLADRSYSLYLVHYTVLASVGLVAARLLHIADRDAMGGKPLWLAVTLAGCIASFVMADVTYRLVEAPSHRLARRLAAHAKTRSVTN